MSFIDVLLLLNSTGVLGLGIGAFKWGIALDRRVTRIEAFQSVSRPH